MKTTTAYIAINPRHCMACWECVRKCPMEVLGKTGFLWHKHVKIKDADVCIGCGKCIKTCPHGVFSKTDETAPINRRNAGMPFLYRASLPLTFVASAVTGIGLHVTGHGTDHELWYNWGVAHVVSSLLWSISTVSHIKQHRSWYKTFLSRSPGKKSWIPFTLSVLFSIVVVTGIILLVCISGANSIIGLWHYKLGLLLLILSVYHGAVRKEL